jgi:DNA-binding NarL/FixJ family response regulator
MIRVFIADDSKAVRIAIRRLLESNSDIQVVGEANDYDEMLDRLRSAKPNVLVCDLRMPAGPKFHPTQVAELARACQCVVIAVTFAEMDDRLREIARQIGAAEILTKTELYDTLVPEIREAFADEPTDVRSLRDPR